jgi:hypothetical protein
MGAFSNEWKNNNPGKYEKLQKWDLNTELYDTIVRSDQSKPVELVITCL